MIFQWKDCSKTSVWFRSSFQSLDVCLHLLSNFKGVSKYYSLVSVSVCFVAWYFFSLPVVYPWVISFGLITKPIFSDMINWASLIIQALCRHTSIWWCWRPSTHPFRRFSFGFNLVFFYELNAHEQSVHSKCASGAHFPV